jgi:hypothetical protein
VSFYKSKGQGDIGESLFFQAHEGRLEKIDGLKGDFVLKETGQKLELKTDLWVMDRTPNFFMERYSNKATQSPGGPWQSAAHGSDLFIYFYVKDLTFYQFETKKLVEALERIVPTLAPTDIPNTGYVTQGYRVPRTMLADIATIKRIKVKVEE